MSEIYLSLYKLIVPYPEDLRQWQTEIRRNTRFPLRARNEKFIRIYRVEGLTSHTNFKFLLSVYLEIQRVKLFHFKLLDEYSSHEYIQVRSIPAYEYISFKVPTKYPIAIRRALSVCLPFNTDGQSETNGATDGDVIERVEQRGEHQGVHTAVNRDRPGEYWEGRKLRS